MTKLYEEFLKIADHLNKELDFIPVLYGSLGLQMISGLDFSPQDIDILVPREFIEDKWNDLKMTTEKLGFQFIDLHEHEFHKSNIKLAFAFMEDLDDFAGVSHAGLEVVDVDGVKYKRLSLDDYLKVYSKSMLDGYRSTKNNNKDRLKIQEIKKMLGKDI